MCNNTYPHERDKKFCNPQTVAAAAFAYVTDTISLSLDNYVDIIMHTVRANDVWGANNHLNSIACTEKNRQTCIAQIGLRGRPERLL